MRISPINRSRLLLASTFLVAMIVSLIRWPDWAQSFRPDWVGMVLIYWCLAIPHRVGVGTGFVVGLMEDILYGSLLGQYALAKTLIAFVAVRMHLKIRMFPRWQQAVVVFLLLLMGQVIVAWAKALPGDPPRLSLLLFLLPMVLLQTPNQPALMTSKGLAPQTGRS